MSFHESYKRDESANNGDGAAVVFPQLNKVSGNLAVGRPAGSISYESSNIIPCPRAARRLRNISVYIWPHLTSTT